MRADEGERPERIAGPDGESEVARQAEKDTNKQRPKVVSPRKSKRGSKESVGGDGIGRLDA